MRQIFELYKCPLRLRSKNKSLERERQTALKNFDEACVDVDFLENEIQELQRQIQLMKQPQRRRHWNIQNIMWDSDQPRSM